MPYSAAYWIDKLGMESHVEGGAFAEIYRSPLLQKKEDLPPAFNGDRNYATAIYFLLQQGQFSAFHRIASDELWHFYAGDPIEIFEINSKGELIKHLLGSDPEMGQSFVRIIPAGSWFASRVVAEGTYGLAGCTVSPGFDFNDFVLADAMTLSLEFPAHKSLIERLCR